MATAQSANELKVQGAVEAANDPNSSVTAADAQKKIIGNTDWEWICEGEWDVPEGWETTTGDAPGVRW